MSDLVPMQHYRDADEWAKIHISSEDVDFGVYYATTEDAISSHPEHLAELCDIQNRRTADACDRVPIESKTFIKRPVPTLAHPCHPFSTYGVKAKCRKSFRIDEAESAD